MLKDNNEMHEKFFGIHSAMLQQHRAHDASMFQTAVGRQDGAAHHLPPAAQVVAHMLKDTNEMHEKFFGTHNAMIQQHRAHDASIVPDCVRSYAKIPTVVDGLDRCYAAES